MTLFSWKDLLLLPLIAAAVYRLRVRGRGFFDGYLSKDSTGALKGLLCVVIFFHHFAGFFESFDILYYILVHIGFLAVALFFFVSGYGLAVSAKNKDGYVKTFLPKRLLRVLVPYWVCLLLYMLAALIFDIPTKSPVNPKNILLSLAGASEIAENSWFVPAIIFLYVLFWLCMRFFKRNTALLLMFSVMAALSGVFIATGRMTVWSSSFFGFYIGVVWGFYQERLETFFRRLFYPKWLLAALATGLFLGLKVLANRGGLVWGEHLAELFASVLFCAVCVLTLFKVKIGNGALTFLGVISFEVYLLHGLFIQVAKGWFGTGQPLAFGAAALLMTIAAAWLVSLMTQKVIFGRSNRAAKENTAQ